MIDLDHLSNDDRKALFKLVRSTMHQAAKGFSRTQLAGELPYLQGYSKFWGPSHRSMLLLWGFLRGFPYKRIERKTREQLMFDGSVVVHNRPDSHDLARLAACFIPNQTQAGLQPIFDTWLKNPEGAIPAPPPRVKKPYTAPTSPTGVAAE